MGEGFECARIAVLMLCESFSGTQVPCCLKPQGSEASAAGVSRDDFAIEEPAPSGPSCKHVLRSMRFIKALYFLGGMNASSWGRYSTIYFNEHGLSMSANHTCLLSLAATGTAGSLGVVPLLCFAEASLALSLCRAQPD